ncbi:hypothetical protein NCC78_15735 [Micromonospora phytophila]|uniref:hypothetical protein n=1 Tax=Micromonospora phytophila TaxID=709888 RepID=UPI00202F4541|nr:hypothetical protein [Micromonospora phytophila]MCM0676129.1 hypothetical protein [Micromonospora phytophila]
MLSGSTSYSYIDALTKPAFSAVAVTGGNAPAPQRHLLDHAQFGDRQGRPSQRPAALRHGAGPNRREHAD